MVAIPEPPDIRARGHWEAIIFVLKNPTAKIRVHEALRKLAGRSARYAQYTWRVTRSGTRGVRRWCVQRGLLRLVGPAGRTQYELTPLGMAALAHYETWLALLRMDD